MKELSAQSSIVGPKCVLPDIAYQYEVSGFYSTDSTSKVCVSGGNFLANKSSCQTGKLEKVLRIIWSADSGRKTISVIGKESETVFEAQIMENLSGGTVDTSSVNQAVLSGVKAKSITCSDAFGGNCNPSYLYQWEQSDDNLIWKEISGEVSRDLPIRSSAIKSMFYRRKCVELVSTSIAYSDVAMIIISNQSGVNQ